MAGKFNTVMVNKDGLVKYPSSGQLTIPAGLNLDFSGNVYFGSGHNHYFDATNNKFVFDVAEIDDPKLCGHQINSIATYVSSNRADSLVTEGAVYQYVEEKTAGFVTTQIPSGGISFTGGNILFLNDGISVDGGNISTSGKTTTNTLQFNGFDGSSIEVSGIADDITSINDTTHNLLTSAKGVKSYVDSKIQPSLDDGWITGFTDHYNTPTLTTTNFPTITNGNLTVSFKAKHESYVYDSNGFAITLYNTYGRKNTGTGSSRVYSMNGIKIIYGYDLTSDYDGNQTTYYQTHTFTVQIGDSTATSTSSAAVTKNYQLTKLVYAPGSSTSGVEAEDLSFILHIGNTVVNGLIPITLTVNNSSNNVTITQSNSYVMTGATWDNVTTRVPYMSLSSNGSGYGKFMMQDIKIGSIELANYVSDRGNSIDSSGTEIAFFKWYDKNDPTRYITGTYYDPLAEWQIHGTNDYLLEPYKTLPFIPSNTTELTLNKIQIGNITSSYLNPLILSRGDNGGNLQNVCSIDMSSSYEKSLIYGAAEIIGYNHYYTLTSKNSYGELKLTGSGAVLQVGDESYTKLRVDENEAKFGVPFKAPVYEITSNGSYSKLDEEVSFRVVKQNGNYTIVIDPPSA